MTTSIETKSIADAVQALVGAAAAYDSTSPSTVPKILQLRAVTTDAVRAIKAGDKTTDGIAADTLHPFLDDLESAVNHEVDSIASRVFVSFCGGTGTGKSTLINALLGAPEENPSDTVSHHDPTAATLCFAYGETARCCQLSTDSPITLAKEIVAHLDSGAPGTKAVFSTFEPNGLSLAIKAHLMVSANADGTHFLFIGPFPGYTDAGGLSKDVVLCDTPGWTSGIRSAETAPVVDDMLRNSDVLVMCSNRFPVLDQVIIATRLGRMPRPLDIPALTGAYQTTTINNPEDEMAKNLVSMLEHTHCAFDVIYNPPSGQDSWRAIELRRGITNSIQVVGHSRTQRLPSARIAALCLGWRGAKINCHLRALVTRLHTTVAFMLAPAFGGGIPNRSEFKKTYASRVVPVCWKAVHEAFSSLEFDPTTPAAEICDQFTQQFSSSVRTALRGVVTHLAAASISGIEEVSSLVDSRDAMNLVRDHLAALAFADWVTSDNSARVLAPLVSLPCDARESLIDLIARAKDRCTMEQVPGGAFASEYKSGVASEFYAAAVLDEKLDVLGRVIGCVETILNAWKPTYPRVAPERESDCHRALDALRQCSATLALQQAPGPRAGLYKNRPVDLAALQETLLYEYSACHERVGFPAPVIRRPHCTVEQWLPAPAQRGLCAIRATIREAEDNVNLTIYPAAQAVIEAFKSGNNSLSPVWHFVPCPKDGGIRLSTAAWKEMNPVRLHIFVYVSGAHGDADLTAQFAALADRTQWTPRYSPILIQINKFTGMHLTLAQVIEASRRISAYMGAARAFLALGNLAGAHELHEDALSTTDAPIEKLLAQTEMLHTQHRAVCCKRVNELVQKCSENTLRQYMRAQFPGYSQAIKCLTALKTDQTKVTVNNLMALYTNVFVTVSDGNFQEKCTPSAQIAIMSDLAEGARQAANLMGVDAITPLADPSLMAIQVLKTNAQGVQLTAPATPTVVPACVLFDLINSEGMSFAELGRHAAAARQPVSPSPSSSAHRHQPPQPSGHVGEEFYTAASASLLQHLAASRSRGRIVLCSTTTATTTTDFSGDVMIERPAKSCAPGAI